MANAFNVPHKFDKSNLRKVILEAPKQFEEGFMFGSNIKLDGEFSKVVFYGEGGSAFPVSLVDTLVKDAAYKVGNDTPRIYQNHTYSLSPEASKDAINIFCSYSGNTEETIATLTKALEKGWPSVVIASGGKLEEIANSGSTTFVKLPVPSADFQPRMGTGYFVACILQILANHGFAQDIKEEILQEVSKLESLMDDYESQGKALAGKITGKTPVVWSSQRFKELARVWTIKFNEHAKNPAFWNFFPELNHNSMVGYTHLGDRYFAIMLRDNDDEEENLKRYVITADILKGYKMDSVVLDLKGDNMFAKMFSSIYTADFTAYYLAEKNQVDPTPVVMVEDFKTRLKS